MIKDMNNKNGTILDGERIVESKLKPYDEVYMGSARVLIRGSVKHYDTLQES